MKPSGTAKHQILVVDDQPLVSKCIKLMLSYEGHAVETADSGAAALKVLEQHRFNLVITDFFMPGLNGDQLAVRIKQQWPAQPILMASTLAEEARPGGQPFAGVDGFLPIPFSAAQLREAITRILPSQPRA